MSWSNSDKAAGLYLMLQMGSMLEPEEVFRCLTLITEMLADRFDIKTQPLPKIIPPELAESLRRCLEEHAA